jgi:hypothetical protein
MEALESSSDDEVEEGDVPQDSMEFALGLSPTSIRRNSSHPPAEKILELWHVFLENFDPLTKVVHGPTLRSTIQRAIVDLSSLPKSLEALLFAIYGAAVVSLNDHDCERRFGEPRKTLLVRYRLATKAALSRAKLMGSANLTVLQALLLHLLSTREVYDSRTLWTLTGVALRIAEGMGLHRDGSLLTLSPFETELRRRVWWQLKLLDGDTAEASGSDKFGALDTDPRSPKLPLNVNDDELYESMSSLPASTDGATDMIFCALRFDLRTYWTTNIAAPRRQCKNGPPWKSLGSSVAMKERDRVLDEFENFLETRYIRYCDPSQPIQLLTTLVARAAVSTARLFAHHPRNWISDEQIPDHERRYVWDLSIKSIKQYNAIHSNRTLQRFSWHAAFYFRWQAFIQILETLRVNPLVEQAHQVWHLIDEVFATNLDFVTDTKKALYVAVGNLCLKAYDAHEGVFANDGKPRPPAPAYINAFRKQREAANARRKNRESDIGNKKAPVDGLPAAAQCTSKERHTPCPTIGCQEQSTGLGGTAPPEVRNSLQPELWPSEEKNQLSDDVFMFTNGNANMDIDMLLAQNTSMDDPLDQTIDWVKWDALLGDFT